MQASPSSPRLRILPHVPCDLLLLQLLAWMADPVPLSQLNPEVRSSRSGSGQQASATPACFAGSDHATTLPASLAAHACRLQTLGAERSSPGCCSPPAQVLGCGNAGGAPGAGSSAAAEKPAAADDEAAAEEEEEAGSPPPPPKKKGKKQEPAPEEEEEEESEE